MAFGGKKMAGGGLGAPVNPNPMANRDYQDEDDHRTMQRASEISTDPTRMAGVKRHQTKQDKKLAIMKKSGFLGGRPMIGGKR